MNALSRFNSWLMRIISSVVSTALVSGLIWITVSYVGAALYTQSQGVDEQVVITAAKENSLKRRGCRYQATAEVFDGAIPEYMCIDEGSYSHPSSTFQLVGKKSFLGVLYNEISVVDE